MDPEKKPATASLEPPAAKDSRPKRGPKPNKELLKLPWPYDPGPADEHEAAAEASFRKPLTRYPDTPEIVAVVEEFNEKYFVVFNFGGRCLVCWEDDDRVFRGGVVLHRQSIYDFISIYQNRPVRVGGTDSKPKFETAGEVWLRHPRRRQYETVEFAPGRDLGPKVFNRWHRFTCEPRQGDCGLYLAHLKENVCRGDEAKYRYLIGWMAYATRNPGEQGHVAIVVSGRKGVGKNVFAEGFSSLWGRHGMVVSSPDRLTGRFNYHLSDKCCLVSDEAVHAGDRRAEGRIKALITGSTIDIEAKGVDVMSMLNYLHIIIIGNDPVLVRATEDERRYLVMSCGDAQRGNKRYFAAIADQLKNGGRAALLHHLLKEVDLKGFEVRNPPRTAELVKLMGAGLRGAEEFWHECLTEGRLPGRLRADGTVGLTIAELLDYACRGRRGRRYAWLKEEHLGHLLGFGPRGMGFGQDRLGPRGAQLRVKSIPKLAEARKLWDERRFEGPWHNDPGWEEERWDVVALDLGYAPRARKR